MITRTKVTRILLLGLAAVILAAGSAQAQEEIEYTWSAPTTGSPVAYYIVQHSVNGGAYVQVAEVGTPSYTLAADYDQEHRIRVAGVDALGRQGTFSVASEPYEPTLGPPGQPGRPIALF